LSKSNTYLQSTKLDISGALRKITPYTELIDLVSVSRLASSAEKSYHYLSGISAFYLHLSLKKIKGMGFKYSDTNFWLR
jgi:hypothetical protein